jgi:hypothetical protein
VKDARALLVRDRVHNHSGEEVTMQRKTKLGLQTLRRAHTFLAARDLRVALGDLKPHVESLGALVTRLEGHAQEQEQRQRSAREATDRKQALAESLHREYLRPISQVAGRLFRNDPGIRSGFRLARKRDNEGLLHAARGFIERASQHQGRFVEAGLAPDFVERLRTATSAFRDAIVARGEEQGRRSSATAGMLQELARGRDLIRLFDTMLVPRLAGEQSQLAEWRTMTRFIRVRGGAALVDDVVDGEESGSEEATAVGITPIVGVMSDATVTPIAADAKAA